MPDSVGRETSTSGPRMVAPDWSKTKTMERADESNEWELTPPGAPTDGPRFQPGIIRRRPRSRTSILPKRCSAFQGAARSVGSCNCRKASPAGPRRRLCDATDPLRRQQAENNWQSDDASPFRSSGTRRGRDAGIDADGQFRGDRQVPKDLESLSRRDHTRRPLATESRWGG